MSYTGDLSHVANAICSNASSTGSIGLSKVNILMRTYVALDGGAKLAAQATMNAVKEGNIKVVNDGGGVFTRTGMRVNGT